MQLKKHYRRMIRAQWEMGSLEQRSEMMEIFGEKFFEKKEQTKRKDQRDQKNRRERRER